ncbi:DUF4339 domain-containing protein [Salinicola aestuarinus]|uniref:DUF4339 domain-containing protein n=1 Tax=Salinicola aestuarinus TaxID=1949082 RepID=UPI000DA1B933|nr:DUF4339 domain-containing protein [Salinicola aestuarinus]
MSQSDPFNDHWYYQDGGNVRGPLSKERMIVAIMDRDIGADTAVWNTSWPEDAATKPLSDTALGDYLTDEARERHQPQPVSDTLAWVLALFPLAFLFIDSALIYNYSPVVFDDGYLFAVPIVYSLIALVDALSIRDSGRSRAPLYWFWVIPVYLAVRAHKLRRGVRFFWMWLVSSVLYGVVVFGIVDGGYFLPSSRPLPACSSPMVTETNKALFDEAVAQSSNPYGAMSRSLQNAIAGEYGNPYANGYSTYMPSPKATDIVDVEEVGETETVRSCQAVVATSHGPDVPIDYRVTRVDGGVEVELRSREG